MWQHAKMHLLFPTLPHKRIRFILTVGRKYNVPEGRIYSFSEDFYKKANETTLKIILRMKSQV